jgi:hypothetical protein
MIVSYLDDYQGRDTVGDQEPRDKNAQPVKELDNRVDITQRPYIRYQQLST